MGTAAMDALTRRRGAPPLSEACPREDCAGEARAQSGPEKGAWTGCAEPPTVPGRMEPEETV